MVVDPEVQRLRAELEAIDRSLVFALAARERTQQELFRHKVGAGMPLSDPDQERRVVRRAEVWARELGLDPRVARAVVREAVRLGLAAHLRGRRGRPEASSVTVFLVPPTLPRPTEAEARVVGEPRHDGRAVVAART